MTKALILAAGEGVRLRPHTLDRPKCLVEVAGRSLLDRHLDVLRAEGIDRILAIGGYRSDMLQRPGLELRLNPRYDRTNMVWTLFCAEEELKGEVILAYGDIVYSRRVLRALLASQSDVAVTIDLDWEAYWRTRSADPLADAETLRLAADGRILEIDQKPRSLDEIQGQYMGLIKLSVAGVAAMKRTYHAAREAGALRGKPVERAYMTDLLQAMIDAGHRVDAVPVRGDWVEVDTVADLESSVTRERLVRIAQA
jgi:L-glutamine-phosphate cytidylyltransferase